MKFIIDVSAGQAIAAFLESSDHDVKRVADINAHMADEEILELSIKENRIIVTMDKDFERMVWMLGKEHRGILRLPSLPKNELLTLFSGIFDTISGELGKGAVIIVRADKIRIRRKNQV